MKSEDLKEIKQSISAIGYDIERLGKKIDKTNELLKGISTLLGNKYGI